MFSLLTLIIGGIYCYFNLENIQGHVLSYTSKQNTESIKSSNVDTIQNTSLPSKPTITQTTKPISISEIKLTKETITFTFYPNQKQWFTTTIITGFVNQNQPVYDKQTFSITFNPNILSFPNTPSANRQFILNTELIIDGYTQYGHFYNYYSTYSGYVYINNCDVPAYIHIIELDQNHMKVTICGDF